MQNRAVYSAFWAENGFQAVHNAFLNTNSGNNAVPMRSGSFSTTGTAFPRAPSRNDPCSCYVDFCPAILNIRNHILAKFIKRTMRVLSNAVAGAVQARLGAVHVDVPTQGVSALVHG